MRFRAKHDFEDGQNVYCAGLSYTVRPGNDALAAKVKTWLAEDRIEIVAGDAQTIDGKGSGPGMTIVSTAPAPVRKKRWWQR